MVIKLYILLALAGAAFGGISPKHLQELKVPEGAVLANFVCPGPGVYQHPDTCSAFISCTDNLEAHEVHCPEGLHFVPSSSPNDASCDLPEIARCDSGVTPDTTTTTTTPAPPVGPPNPGDPCDPDLCVEVGYCLHYYVCNKTDRRWEEKKCGKNLWWNPSAANSSIHGGACDEFLSIPKEIQDIYLADTENCICPCDWFQREEHFCTGTYLYRKPFDYVTSDDSERIETLQCPSKLIWLGHEKLTCGRCQDAVDLKGSPCC